MSIPELLIQGLQLMFMGMGFVFVFLSLLVTAVTFSSRVLAGTDGADAVSVSAKSDAVPWNNSVGDAELVSVITAAVHNYRNQQKS